jgi:hypothetical protein
VICLKSCREGDIRKQTGWNLDLTDRQSDRHTDRQTKITFMKEVERNSKKEKQEKSKNAGDGARFKDLRQEENKEEKRMPLKKKINGKKEKKAS